MNNIYMSVIEIVKGFKDIFFLTLTISVLIFILMFVYYLLNLLDKYLSKKYVNVKLLNNDYVSCTLYKTYENGKIFKHEGKLIITDHTNVQINCPELEMLYKQK